MGKMLRMLAGLWIIVGGAARPLHVTIECPVGSVCKGLLREMSRKRIHMLPDWFWVVGRMLY